MARKDADFDAAGFAFDLAVLVVDFLAVVDLAVVFLADVDFLAAALVFLGDDVVFLAVVAAAVFFAVVDFLGASDAFAFNELARIQEQERRILFTLFLKAV